MARRKKLGTSGKAQQTSYMYRREARNADEVARGKARHRVSQGKVKQSNASQRASSIYFFKVEEARGTGQWQAARGKTRHEVVKSLASSSQKL